MRVGVDGRSLRSSARSRGITRYVRRLVCELVSGFPEDEYALLVPGGPDAATSAALREAGVELHAPRGGHRPLFAASALSGRPRADRLVGGADVMWIPAVAPVAVSDDVPFVLTVHDVSFELRPSDYSPYERAWHRIARPHRLASRAERVITVSETVRSRVLEAWGLLPERVVTVRSGPGKTPGARGTLPAGVRSPYLLAVGALEPRKQPGLLIDAHARARAAGLEAGLVLAGEGPLREELARSQATVLGFVPDTELEALYAEALAVVCVSHDEGFSFTPLEALARGVPVVVADLPVFAETLGDGALRVPAGDASALGELLLAVERDPALRARSVRHGQAAIARLSWEAAAGATRAVLLEAAGR